MSNSKNCDKCIGCKHITDTDNEWCYMFLDAPEILPCGQHDKYSEQRKANGRKIYEAMKNKKNPRW